MYRLLITILTFSIYSSAQSIQIDSSLVKIKSQVCISRAKNITSLQKIFADSGVNKRLDSIDYAYVVIHSYGNKKSGFSSTEFYFANADSVPFLIYQNYSVYDSLYYHSFKSFNEMTSELKTGQNISKRPYHLVEHYHHGCIIPQRSHARRIVNHELQDYDVNFYYNKTNQEVKTQTFLPRRFHPFFMTMSGGLY